MLYQAIKKTGFPVRTGKPVLFVSDRTASGAWRASVCVKVNSGILILMNRELECDDEATVQRIKTERAGMAGDDLFYNRQSDS